MPKSATKPASAPITAAVPSKPLLSGPIRRVSQAPTNKASVSLDGAVQGAATNVQGTVKSKKTITYAGYEGRDSIVTVRSGGEDLTVFARFLQVDNKLFQLQYVVPEKDLDAPPAGYDDVLASISFD